MDRKFIIKIAIAIAAVFLGVSAFGIAVASSAAERALTDAVTKPFRYLAGKTDFQFSDHQQLRKVFLVK